MQANVYENNRTESGPFRGFGPGGIMPQLWAPGVVRSPLAAWCGGRSDKPGRITLEPCEAERLALAVIGQALRDAKRTDPHQKAARAAAVVWLGSGEAAAWLELLGRRINQVDIDNYLKVKEVEK